MKFRALWLPVAAALALAACSSDKAPTADTAAPAAATPAAGTDANAASTGTAAPAASTAGAIHVQITGGEHAGSYDVANTDGCSYNIAGEGAWGNQFSRESDNVKDLASVQLIVPDAKAAAMGTDQFMLTVGFGPMMGNSVSYTVDTRSGGGKGTVKVDDRDTSGTVTFDGSSAEGVRLQGTIECAQAVRG